VHCSALQCVAVLTAPSSEHTLIRLLLSLPISSLFPPLSLSLSFSLFDLLTHTHTSLTDKHDFSLSFLTHTHPYTHSKDITSAMTTQFHLFTGFELPRALSAAFRNPTFQNFPLVIHAVASCGLQFFVMSNFLVCGLAG